VKHVFSVIGLVAAVLLLTSRSFARQAHLTHGKEWLAAAGIVLAFHVAGALIGRAVKPKAPATPARPVYPFSGSGTRH
jgi:hypothetical protein